MSDTPARLLRLLSLLQSARAWSGSELAAHLEVSGRTIRRDIERLRALGYPVEAALGAVGGYRLVGGTAMPPLLLDDEEAVAIAVGLRTAVGTAVEGVEEASIRALTKLQQVLPPRLRARVGAVSRATVPLSLAGVAATVEPEVLTVLAQAIASGARVRFDYRASDGTESLRHAEPWSVVAAGRRWYLVAHDDDRGAWRVFRIDRIRDPRQIARRTSPRERPGDDAAAFVRDRLFALAPTYRAVVTLHLSAGDASSRLGDLAAVIEPIDDAHCRLTCAADTLGWLAFRLVLIDCEFTVHEPPELIDHLRELGGRVLRATALTTSAGLPGDRRSRSAPARDRRSGRPDPRSRPTGG